MLSHFALMSHSHTEHQWLHAGILYMDDLYSTFAVNSRVALGRRQYSSSSEGSLKMVVLFGELLQRFL